MIPLTWRQHRLQTLAAAVLLAALAGYLLWNGHQMTSYEDSIGLAGCLAAHGQCPSLIDAFFNRFSGVPAGFFLLNLVPLLAGLFWGAPLIAREVEGGTHRMAWTQSISRRRWLATKLAYFIMAGILAALALSLLITWWLRPLQALSLAGQTKANRMAPTLFDLSGIMPVGTTLFAFALGTAAGALIRRTVAAMAVTIGGFLAAWMPLESARYHFPAPITATVPFGSGLPSVPGSYALATGQVDAAGHPVTFQYLLSLCGTEHGGEIGLNQTSVKCLAAKGYQYTETYQPDSRYWSLQGIETGLVLAAAIALLALAAWWTSRRIS